MESPPSFVARHGGKVTNYYAIRESEAAARGSRPLTESARTGGAARQLVVDRHLGSLDVDISPCTRPPMTAASCSSTWLGRSGSRRRNGPIIFSDLAFPSQRFEVPGFAPPSGHHRLPRVSAWVAATQALPGATHATHATHGSGVRPALTLRRKPQVDSVVVGRVDFECAPVKAGVTMGFRRPKLRSRRWGSNRRTQCCVRTDASAYPRSKSAARASRPPTRRAVDDVTPERSLRRLPARRAGVPASKGSVR